MRKCQQWFTFYGRITNDLPFLPLYFPEFFPMVIYYFGIKKKVKPLF